MEVCDGVWNDRDMGNPVVHFELIGPDPARLRQFYSRLFGWDAPAGAPVAEQVSQPTEYSFIAPADNAPPAAGGIGGGAGFESHAIFYVGVETVSEVLSTACDCGAYAACQRPSAFAASTAARPAGSIRPSLSSRAT